MAEKNPKEDILLIRTEEDLAELYAAHPGMKPEDAIVACLAGLPLAEFQRRCRNLTHEERLVAEWIWGGRCSGAYYNLGELATVAEESRRNYLRESLGLRAVRG